MGEVVAPKLVFVDLISENSELSFEVAGRMAQAIMELRKKNGGCVPQDLNQIGFSYGEVAGNWDAAHFLMAINDKDTWGKNNAQDTRSTIENFSYPAKRESKL